MKKGTSLLSLVLICFLAGLVYWANQDRPSFGPGAVPDPASSVAQVSEPMADLVAIDEPDQPGSLGSTRIEFSAGEDAHSVGQESHLTLVVQDKDTSLPVAGAYVVVSKNGAGTPIDDRSTGVAGERLSSNADGRVEFTVPPGVKLFAWVRAKEVGYEDSSDEIDPLLLGERRLLEIKLARETLSVDYSRVLDRETGDPLSSAQITRVDDIEATHSSLRDRSPIRGWEITGEVVARSDQEGRFSLVYRSAHPNRYEIHADGYGPAWAYPLGQHPNPETPLLIRVYRSASLAGIIRTSRVARNADSSRDLSVQVRASSFALIDWESQGGRNVVPSKTWRTMVSEDGSYRLDSLPVNTDLEFEVRKGPRKLHRRPQPLNLLPGEERRLDWSEGEGSIVSGRVLAENGQQGQRRLWLVAATQTKRRKLFSRSDRPAYKTTSSMDGTFQFEDVAPGFYWLGPRPIGNEGKTALSILAEVPTSEEFLLSLGSEYLIEGRAVFDGKGVDNIEVHAMRDDVRGFPKATTDASGAFQLFVPLAGSWSISSYQSFRGPQSPALTQVEPVSALAGSQGVLLRMAPAARLVIRIE